MLTASFIYPGGGLQARLGPVGLRLDLGDEARNARQPRVAFGPVFRF
jgi:hypothetical protein